jgi:hypothetical protein
LAKSAASLSGAVSSAGKASGSSTVSAVSMVINPAQKIDCQQYNMVS